VKILFITAGIVPVRGVSNSYQEAFMEAIAARGHEVACLCTVGFKLQPGVSWACEQQQPYRRYTVFNGGVYPAHYAQGGVGSRKPLRDVHSGAALRRAILEIVLKEEPDVVNIQSLFGLPFDLVDFIRQKGIPVMFTAHDYFALCPTAHLFLPEEQPCRLAEAELVCHKCCERSPSYSAFWLSCQLDQMATGFGSRPAVRNSIWRVRNAVKRMDGLMPKPRNSRNYSARRREAIEFLKRVDVLHCISQRQAGVFQEICGELTNLRVVPLVPPTIEQLISVPRSKNENKKLSFVALNVNGAYKGAKLLEKTFQSLAQTGGDYELHVYGNAAPGPQIQSVFYHGRYKSSDLDQIAAAADFCIVPSVWDETLCFVGMEMLARGVPLLASSRAGVSEFIVAGRNGLVFDPGQEASLHNTILEILRAPKNFAHMRGQPPPPQLKTFKEHVVQMAAFLETAAKPVSNNTGLRNPLPGQLAKANEFHVEVT
jgi:glycosyltransferase involved in cell wall biosynthesis